MSDFRLHRLGLDWRDHQVFRLSTLRLSSAGRSYKEAHFLHLLSHEFIDHWLSLNAETSLRGSTSDLLTADHSATTQNLLQQVSLQPDISHSLC
jgi:hypothetical protein